MSVGRQKDGLGEECSVGEHLKVYIPCYWRDDALVSAENAVEQASVPPRQEELSPQWSTRLQLPKAEKDPS